jgi:hypothetical protein
MGRERRSKRELTFWAVGLAALLIAGGSLIGSSPTGGSSARVLSRASPGRLVRTPAGLAPIRRSVPVRLVIGSLGIATHVGSVGLLPNHQVMVPTSTRTVSWFRLGPTPGQIGSSVILGHVDSYQGPGVFFNLKLLRPGAVISVTLADGATARFGVVRVVQYSKTGFPDRLVYGAHGTRLLNLVTCGGVFNRATGHYESNIVVFSKLVSVVAPAARASHTKA